MGQHLPDLQSGEHTISIACSIAGAAAEGVAILDTIIGRAAGTGLSHLSTCMLRSGRDSATRGERTPERTCTVSTQHWLGTRDAAGARGGGHRSMRNASR